jgi:hypothetical protein
MKGAPGMPQIARRACGRERSAFQGFTMARGRVARGPGAPSLPQRGDRGFESISLQRGVCCEPDFLDLVGGKRTLALMREGWGRMHPQLWFDAGDGPGPVIAEAGARPRDRAACARRLAAYRKRPPVAPHRSGFLRLAFRGEPVR